MNVGIDIIEDDLDLDRNLVPIHQKRGEGDQGVETEIKEDTGTEKVVLKNVTETEEIDMKEIKKGKIFLVLLIKVGFYAL